MEAKESANHIGWIGFLLLSACILCARLVYWYLASPTYFPFTEVKVAATFQHVSREQLSETLSSYMNYSYFSLPVSRLRQELKAMDWVNDVMVKRIWPNRLCIKIIEKNPKVRWNNQLMMEDGTVMHMANTSVEQLPHLLGPMEQQEDVLQEYQKLSKILSRVGLTLTMLRLHPNQSWTAGLTGGIVLKLGKRDIDVKVIRFCRAYPASLADKREQLAIVDLRYARGMAVKWKVKREHNG